MKLGILQYQMWSWYHDFLVSAARKVNSTYEILNALLDWPGITMSFNKLISLLSHDNIARLKPHAW